MCILWWYEIFNDLLYSYAHCVCSNEEAVMSILESPTWVYTYTRKISVISIADAFNAIALVINDKVNGRGNWPLQMRAQSGLTGIGNPRRGHTGFARFARRAVSCPPEHAEQYPSERSKTDEDDTAQLNNPDEWSRQQERRRVWYSGVSRN